MLGLCGICSKLTRTILVKPYKNWPVINLTAFKTIQVTFHLTYFSGGGTVVLIITIPGNQVNIQTFPFSSIAPYFLLSLNGAI